jgi:hypothetical protein
MFNLQFNVHFTHYLFACCGGSLHTEVFFLQILPDSLDAFLNGLSIPATLYSVLEGQKSQGCSHPFRRVSAGNGTYKAAREQIDSGTP